MSKQIQIKSLLYLSRRVRSEAEKRKILKCSFSTSNMRYISDPTSSPSNDGNLITRDTRVDHDVAEALKSEHLGPSGNINYRRHPGVMRRKTIQLPTRLVKAIKIVLEKYPVPSVSVQADKLVRYLQQRQPPISDHDLSIKTKIEEEKYFEKEAPNFYELEGEELETALELHRKKILSRLRRTVYHWKPMKFDAFSSYLYLVGRISSDYSILLQCFTEISNRDNQFKPTSIYHDCSRVGAGVWASDKTWRTVGEHYCVDENTHMNTLARLLLHGGNEQEATMSINGVHFRHFSPSSKENKFSLVVSAFSLMEQSSEQDRASLVATLWEMTRSYLVLVEVGTTAGFSLINEAKEFISSMADSVEELKGHVFAPCPHDRSCPKLREKCQPCLTECSMKEPDFSVKTASKAEKLKRNARYSYVIMKKGKREEDAAWPRVLHQINAQRHTHCHICLPCGEMQHVVITKGKFEKHLYSCARHVDQGDRLPVSLTSHPLQKIQDQDSDVEESDDIKDDDPFLAADEFDKGGDESRSSNPA